VTEWVPKKVRDENMSYEQVSEIFQCVRKGGEQVPEFFQSMLVWHEWKSEKFQDGNRGMKGRLIVFRTVIMKLKQSSNIFR